MFKEKEMKAIFYIIVWRHSVTAACTFMKTIWPSP